MAHLEFEEILEFVSIRELNRENLDLIAKVGHHVARCEECDKMVSAVQTIYEEFARLGKLSQSGENVLTPADLGLDDVFGEGEKKIQLNK